MHETYKRIAKMLFEVGEIKVNAGDKNGSTRLCKAIQKNQLGIVDILLSLPGIGVNKLDNEGQSPLYMAAKMQSREIVKMLLNVARDRFGDATGIEVEFNEQDPNDKNNTLLHWGAERQDDELVRLLCWFPNINPNMRNKEGNTPLQFPNINPKMWNEGGNTPLHIAAKKACTFMVEALLSVPHININIRNKRNQTPLDVANEERNQKMEALLRDRGGLRWNEVMQLYR
jgi:E3 ubiquitin-protein ligase mind-bomb